MADNDHEAGKMSRKEAKRDAKIEAKRRKLAEQRASRNAAAQAEAARHEEEFIRPVTADSSNRERLPRTSVLTDAERQAIKDRAKAEEIASEQPESAGLASEITEEGAVSQEQAYVSVKADAAPAKNRQKKDTAKKFASRCASKIKSLRNVRLTPKRIALCAVVLAVIIGGIYAISQTVDRNSKEVDVFVTGEGYDHAGKFDSCVPLNGIDVSMHQAGKIDWNKVKSSGVDFVFVRAGYRAADDGSLHADENFASNFKGASKAGLLVGAYFYSQALNEEEGIEEAKFALDVVKDHELTMPLVIDYETYKDGRLDKRIKAGEMYAASFYHDAVLGFTHTVEDAGYESAVYASRNMLTNYMQADLLDDSATIWIARYEKTASLDANYWFWQYTDEGKVGGIEGNVDTSFWYMEPEKVYPTRAKQAENTISVGDCRISFQRSKTRLHNFRAEPKYAMTYEGQGMKEGVDFVSRVVNNTRAGTGYVIVRGIGKYKDWIMYPFTIEE